MEDYLYDAPSVVFTRLGAIYPDKAKLAIRYPHHEGPIHVVWRKFRESSDLQAQPWTLGPPIILSEAGDWVNSTTISPLWPNTIYEYSLATLDKQLLSYPPIPIKFKTFPDPRLPHSTPLRFVVSSCMKPNFPYVPLGGDRIKGMDLLADYLWPSDTVSSTLPPMISSLDQGDLAKRPDRTTPSALAEFMLFLGDFVYADVPYYFGDDLEAYRRLYRRNYQSSSFRRVYERLPIFFTYDDHEFVNNYAGSSLDRGPYVNGSRAFLEYNGQTNFDSPDQDQLYYEFSYGADPAFFVLDTRRHRSTLEVEVGSRSMLGSQQLGTFLRWLSKVNSTSTFKFIITSVPFTSLWTHDARVDSWAAYTEEKTSILNAIATVPNVIILSGDRHEFALVEFNHFSSISHPTLEISTSPLSMFYIPFVRTLLPASSGKVSRKYVHSTIHEDGNDVVTESFEQIPHERVLKYLPIGNHKWSAIEVDTSNPEHPVSRLEVVIDGKVSHRHTIRGSSILQPTTELGFFVPALRDMMLKIGIKPNTWF